MTKHILISKNSFPLNISLRNYLQQIYNKKLFAYIEETDVTENSVFVVEYQEFIQQKHIDNLIKCSVGKGYVFIRHDFGVEIEKLASEILNIIVNYKVESNKISVQFAYDSDKQKLEKILKESLINDVKIFVYECYMDSVYKDYKSTLINSNKLDIKTKFSVFSRRYDSGRFILYLELLKRNLLKEFLYTFSNGHAEIRPYPYTDVEIPELIEFAKSHDYNQEYITNWINGLPYSDLENFTDPFDISIYNLLSQSHINIVIETAQQENEIVQLTLTEKVYKPIILKKPFYMFGTYKSLLLLQEEGFKTFSPFLDESYALVPEDDEPMDYRKKKIAKICDDIERINNLNSTQFENLINEMNYIVEYNFNHFLKLAESKHQNYNKILEYLELV